MARPCVAVPCFGKDSQRDGQPHDDIARAARSYGVKTYGVKTLSPQPARVTDISPYEKIHPPPVKFMLAAGLTPGAWRPYAPHLV